jgi:hypothetical protein
LNGTKEGWTAKRRNWSEESERIAAEEKKKADDMALYENRPKD